MMGKEISSTVNKTAPKLYIGPVPERKSIALCVVDGSVIHTCAYFRDEAEAERFLDAFRQINGMPSRRGIDEQHNNV